MKTETRGESDGSFGVQGVRVLPFEDGWTTLYCGGHFSFPYTKAEAIKRAMLIASDAKLKRIWIMNAGGEFESAMSLSSSGVWACDEQP